MIKKITIKNAELFDIEVFKHFSAQKMQFCLISRRGFMVSNFAQASEQQNRQSKMLST